VRSLLHPRSRPKNRNGHERGEVDVIDGRSCIIDNLLNDTVATEVAGGWLRASPAVQDAVRTSDFMLPRVAALLIVVRPGALRTGSGDLVARLYSNLPGPRIRIDHRHCRGGEYVDNVSHARR
jgi:hypothetical protein